MTTTNPATTPPTAEHLLGIIRHLVFKHGTSTNSTDPWDRYALAALASAERALTSDEQQIFHDALRSSTTLRSPGYRKAPAERAEAVPDEALDKHDITFLKMVLGGPSTGILSHILREKLDRMEKAAGVVRGPASPSVGQALELLWEVYHQAWHATDDGEDRGDEGCIIMQADAAALEEAINAFEEAFPMARHGDGNADDLKAAAAPTRAGALDAAGEIEAAFRAGFRHGADGLLSPDDAWATSEASHRAALAAGDGQS